MNEKKIPERVKNLRRPRVLPAEKSACGAGEPKNHTDAGEIFGRFTLPGHGKATGSRRKPEEE